MILKKEIEILITDKDIDDIMVTALEEGKRYDS